MRKKTYKKSIFRIYYFYDFFLIFFLKFSKNKKVKFPVKLKDTKNKKVR